MTNCSLNSIACTPLYQHLSNLKSSPQQVNSGTYIVHVAQNNDPIEAIDFHSNTNNLNHSHSTLITSFSFADIKKETNQKQESNSKCTSHQFPYKECRSHQHARVVNCKHLNQCIDYASDHGPVKKMALSQLILLACVMFLYEYLCHCVILNECLLLNASPFPGFCRGESKSKQQLREADALNFRSPAPQ